VLQLSKYEEATVLLWQRLLITLAVMLLTSFVAGLLWHWLFNTDIPSYLSGVVGGATAVPAWEVLKRVEIR
jgi:polyferredoxin